MLELFLCSLLTVIPDYLFRHYYQGKRIGHEITLYSVWYELRWGISACLILTLLLITVIFYNHPASANVTSYYRTVPIIPEVNGRVADVFVKIGDMIDKGQPIFKLDSARQEAAIDTAKKTIAEVDAAMVVARSEVAGADGQIQQAKGDLQQAIDELDTKMELRKRNADVVASREIERLQNIVDGRKGGVAAAEAAKQAAEAKLSTLLPAQRASAEAALQQAQVDWDKATVRAGVAGNVEQFVLQVGDFVNPFRPAGVLIPEGMGKRRLQVGFPQIEAQVIKPGMAAEAVCMSKPLTVIPMVVVDVQDVIATGQFRMTEQLIDTQQIAQPGTLTVVLEPLFPDGLDGVAPGSSCVANAYSSNHDEIAKSGFLRGTYLHMVDATAVVHAILLRVQALLMPIRILVLSGH
ncbi:MAG TPA: biotin/lipoyl-binding protein [Hyphomicrobium sp.]|nr:biotin/lipoyl-binding protein [Hyphomicrobium sp.]